MNTSPQNIYHQRIKDLSVLLKELKSRKSRLAWLRSGAAIAAFIACYLLWPYGLPIAIGAFILLFAVFFRLVIIDTENSHHIANTQTLLSINNEEIKIAAHQFTHRDDGSYFLPAVHAYAADLDIFGRASLYQYSNRTTSEQGNKLFNTWLLNPATAQEIEERQVAAKELADIIEFRQQLQAYGLRHQLTIGTEKRIINWLKQEDQFSEKASWKIARWILPGLSLLSAVLCIAGVLSTGIFLNIAILFFIISGAITKKIMPAYNELNKIAPEVETLSDSIRWIENVSFKSEFLQRLRQQVLQDNQPASRAIKQLNKILERFDVRMNPVVFVPLNTFLFWDLQQAFALEKWKKENRDEVSRWFHTLATMETISTVGTLTFNHPGWMFPTLSQDPGTFAATDLGHPLIDASKRITSSFSTEGLNQLALITGSNMAGKSTFLRSVGVNMVLAMMGAPVCATSFTVSPMKIMSSMRIADNLEENTSTFYAELKKLKDIIEAVNRHEPVFLLLDEILRGTNSLDRHTGSKALIKQLIRHEAVGMIATHDIELAKLAAEFPGHIHNYHFDVQVANDELYFDYKLKHGVCQSLNASILMKKIGIEL